MATKKPTVTTDKPKAAKKAAAKRNVVTEERQFDVNDALFAFQGEQVTVPRNGKGIINGREYSYPTLDDSLTITAPFLQKHGLMVTQVGVSTDLVTILMHVKSKTQIVSTLPLGNPGSSQDLGSRISYLRRYMYNAMLRLPNEDIDGAAGAKVTAPAAAQPAHLSTPVRANIPVTPTAPQVTPETAKVAETTAVAQSPAAGQPVAPATPKVERSQFFLNAEKAIKSAMSVEAIDELREQVKRSQRLTDDEKSELLATIRKNDDSVHV